MRLRFIFTNFLSLLLLFKTCVYERHIHLLKVLWVRETREGKSVLDISVVRRRRNGQGGLWYFSHSYECKQKEKQK